MYKNIKLYFVIITAVLVLISTGVNAVETKVTAGSLSGYSTYSIQGDTVEGWKSRLEFPLNVEFLKVSYQEELGGEYIDNIRVSLAHNIISEYAGVFKDSDWNYDIQDSKLIYSESSSKLSAWIMDFNMQSYIWENKKNNNVKFTLLTGIRKQIFNFDIYDSVQWDYYTGQKEVIEGSTIYYNINYTIPYLGIKLNNSFSPKVNWNMNILYSPLAAVSDKDNHLLRKKLSYSNARGKALIKGIELSYNVNNQLKAGVSYNIMKIETTGGQNQYTYDGQLIAENIDAEISSRQEKCSLYINYIF